MGAAHTCPPTTVPTPAHQPLWLLRLSRRSCKSGQGRSPRQLKTRAGSLGNQLPLLRRWRRGCASGLLLFSPTCLQCGLSAGATEALRLGEFDQ